MLEADNGSLSICPSPLFDGWRTSSATAHMKSSLRPTSIEDMSAVRQFLQQAFNSSLQAPFLEPAVMAWKYWDRRGDWDEPRAYVLERNGAIVAHVGICPVTFGASGLRGAQMIDWASAKETPGTGVALVQKLVAMFDFIYSIGGSEMTRKALPAFGFVECAQQWNGARPLRPVRQILTHQDRNWKLGPRFIRNFLWASPKKREGSFHQAWKSEEIAPDEISKELYSLSPGDARFSPRPPAYFEYLLRCPIARVRLYGIRDERELKGHFAVGVLRGQARVAGVWLRNPDREAWKAAFYLAQRAARRIEGACEIVAAGTKGPSEEGAAQSGLRIVGHIPVYLLNKKEKLALPPDFQFQLSDDDALFRDFGNYSYWP